mgnify:CR=1 FL=1
MNILDTLKVGTKIRSKDEGSITYTITSIIKSKNGGSITIDLYDPISGRKYTQCDYFTSNFDKDNKNHWWNIVGPPPIFTDEEYEELLV